MALRTVVRPSLHPDAIVDSETGTIALAPYANSHDQTLLIMPIVIASGVAGRRSERARWVVRGPGAIILAGVTPLTYEVALRRHSETLGALVPLAV